MTAAASAHHDVVDDAPLLHALHVHAALVELLPLADAMRLLSVCRALRHDAILAAHALHACASVSHWRAGCSSDWCELRSSVACYNGRYWALCGGTLDCSCATRSDTSIQTIGANCPFAVQSLSITGFVEQKLFEWSFSSVSLHCRVEERGFWQRVQDTRFVCRPLIVPLRSLLDSHDRARKTERWWLSDRDTVRSALNQVHPGFGDSFLPLTSEQTRSRRASDLLGYHWDAITIETSTTKGGHLTASCALCNWRERMIREYTACSPAMLSLGTTQIYHLHMEEDAILRQILDSEAQLPEWLRGQDVHVDESQQTLAEWLYCALCRYHRRQCETFYQPLKKLFVAHGFAFVTAVDVDWIESTDVRGRDQQPTQLLAGVSPSGFLCGLYRIYRMDVAR